MQIASLIKKKKSDLRCNKKKTNFAWSAQCHVLIICSSRYNKDFVKTRECALHAKLVFFYYIQVTHFSQMQRQWKYCSQSNFSALFGFARLIYSSVFIMNFVKYNFFYLDFFFFLHIPQMQNLHLSSDFCIYN